MVESLLAQRLHFGDSRERPVDQGFRYPLEVERIVPEAVDMFRPIWCQRAESLPTELVSLVLQLTEQLGRGGDRVEDYEARDEVVVLDHLALFVAVVLGDDATAAEGHPLGETVECFALIGRRADRPPELGVADVAQEKERADDPAELAKGEVELVLAARGAKAPEYRGGRHVAGLDRDGDAQHVGEVRLDELPVDGLVEETVNVLIPGIRGRPEKLQVLPVADPRHELDAEQVRECEDLRALRLRIAVDRVGLNQPSFFSFVVPVKGAQSPRKTTLCSIHPEFLDQR